MLAEKKSKEKGYGPTFTRTPRYRPPGGHVFKSIIGYSRDSDDCLTIA